MAGDKAYHPRANEDQSSRLTVEVGQAAGGTSKKPVDVAGGRANDPAWISRSTNRVEDARGVSHAGPRTRGAKAMPMDDDTATLDAEPEAAAPEEEDGLPEEPLGLALLRRVHEDRRYLMEEYDKYMEHLEEKDVKKLLTKFLSNMDAEMSEIEEFCEAHEEYSKRPPMEGGEPGNLGGENEAEAAAEPEPGEVNEAEATSGGGLEEPTPEEAAEGTMRETPEQEEERGEKSLQTEMGKALEFYRRAKGLCPACGHDPCTCADGAAPGNEEHQAKPGKPGASPAGGTDIGVEEHQHGPGTDEGSPAGELAPGNEEHNHGVGILPHHHRDIDEASGFLGKLSTSTDYGDHERMHSFHHGMALGKIADEIGGAGKKDGEDMGAGGMVGGASLEAAGEKAMPEGNRDDSATRSDRREGPGAKATENTPIMKSKQTTGFGGAPGGSKLPGMPHGVVKPSTNRKKGGFEEMDELEDFSNVQEHPHASILKDASGFLKKIAQMHPHDFGQDERIRAAKHGTELAGVLKEALSDTEIPADGGEGEAPAEGEAGHPGEVGEKSLGALEEVAKKQREELLNLNGQLKEVFLLLNGKTPVTNGTNGK